VRFLGLGARSLACGVRWAWQPGDHADAKDRRALRDMYISFAALIGVGVLLTTGAVRASGWQRLPWAVSALVTWLFTTRSVVIDALVTAVVAGGKDIRQMGGNDLEAVADLLDVTATQARADQTRTGGPDAARQRTVGRPGQAG